MTIVKSKTFVFLFNWLLIFFATIIFFSCNVKQLRTPNGTTLFSKTWEINVSDSNRIFVSDESINITSDEANIFYKLNTYDDSLCIRRDTIKYLDPEESNEFNQYKKFFNEVNQIVLNSRNKKYVELYIIKSKGTFLGGYITANALNPFKQFDPYLIIIPSTTFSRDSTTSYMKTWNSEKKAFENNVETKSFVKLRKHGKILYDKKEDNFFLYEVKIKQDAIVNYGVQDLIIPEAIMQKTNLLYLEKRGLVAEWGVRVKKRASDGSIEDSQQLNDVKTYIEFTMYSSCNEK